jgi:hypothetical protein
MNSYCLTLVLSAVTVAGAACSQSKTSAQPTQPTEPASSAQTPCSDGPPYDATTVFPFAPRGREALPDCTPRCGVARRLDATYESINALPRGTCAGASACRLAAREACPDPAEEGPLTVFRCDCTDSDWTCAILDRGARICSSAGPADSGITPEAGAGFGE